MGKFEQGLDSGWHQGIIGVLTHVMMMLRLCFYSSLLFGDTRFSVYGRNGMVARMFTHVGWGREVDREDRTRLASGA